MYGLHRMLGSGIIQVYNQLMVEYYYLDGLFGSMFAFLVDLAVGNGYRLVMIRSMCF